MVDPQSPMKRGLRPAQAAIRLGCSLPTFWRLARNDPAFPPLCKISERVTTIDEGELDVYVELKTRRRAQGAAA